MVLQRKHARNGAGFGPSFRGNEFLQEAALGRGSQKRRGIILWDF
jgi:hypothetical protein